MFPFPFKETGRLIEEILGHSEIKCHEGNNEYRRKASEKLPVCVSSVDIVHYELLWNSIVNYIDTHTV